MPNVTILR